MAMKKSNINYQSKTKRLLVLFLLLNFASASYGQTFLNGSFESNIATNCLYNISNAQFDSLMSNVRGVGVSETIDIFYDFDCPFFGAAQSGNYYVSVENNFADTALTTAISLKLSDTLQAGNIYSFCFYDKGILLGNGPIVIGVSNTDSTFGSMIYIAPTVDTAWTLRSVTFTAPFAVRYITVKYGSPNGGAMVDNFNFCTGIGIDDHTSIEELNAFPNPFFNQITFSTSINEQATISLYDLLGRQILNQTFSNSTTINTEQFESGIYFYELRNSSRIIDSGKVVKR